FCKERPELSWPAMNDPNPYESPKSDPTRPNPRPPITQKQKGFLIAARGSLMGAAILIFFDAALDGSYLMSVLVCPVWFFVSVVKNAIQRQEPGIVLFRIAIQAL